MLNNLPTVEPTQPDMMFDLTMGEKVKNLNIRPWVTVSRHQGWASLDFGSEARDLALTRSPSDSFYFFNVWMC